jgi:hypothetical protein
MPENQTISWQLASSTALPKGVVSRRMYFFTESLPEGSRNIHHVYAPVQKLGVVLEGDTPWEGGSVSSFCGSIVSLDDGNYRLYYTTVTEHEMHLAVAESEDGLHWLKPSLGQEPFRGGSTNRIILGGVPVRQDQVAQPQVLRLRSGGWRMYYWHHQHGWGRVPYLYTVAESDDGLRWHVHHYERPALNSHWLGDQSTLTEVDRLAEKARRTNDANFVYLNPHLNLHEQYSQWFLDATAERRVDRDNCPDFNRMIQRRVSADGLAWSAPELVLQADDHDPWDQQFYSLAIQYHDDWMIGSLGHYRVENAQQTMDLELAFSRDGRRWERPLRGGFIPRDVGGRDSQGIYAPNAWIDRGDRWLCLYTAQVGKHNQLAGPSLPPGCVMAASWPKHRFVGLRADHVSGGFLTPVFYPQASEIKVDADVRGWLRAELCDAWGYKRAGFHLEDSALLHGDDFAHVLHWSGKDTAGLEYDPVRLRLEFADADVYSIAY